MKLPDVSGPVKIIGFVVGLALVFGGALVIGRTNAQGNGPTTGATPTPSVATGGHGHQPGGESTGQESTGEESGGHGHEPGGHGGESGGHEHGGESEHAPGTVNTHEGFTLTLLTPELPVGDQQLRLLITGPDGRPVTDFDVVHEKQLHLIAVRSDLTGFTHVHPTMAPDGTWTTMINLTAGDWRVYADVRPTGETEAFVLGADLTVPGEASRTALPAPDNTVEVDGYTVALDVNPAEGEQDLTVTISRDGTPVTDLQTYLGAYAHVVLLREVDLSYNHVHPHEGGPAGPDVPATVHFPANGKYRMYVEFQHEGSLHRAEFTVEVP
ncbi:hypothetical protein ACQBAU_18190 [Propionibacteriaceae bacterium Y2011]|uniref:hypothetical protein n=1 Tax=Microlunatus sp. Y2014 TaxID=3418488 RepID=UPI003B45CD94